MPGLGGSRWAPSDHSYHRDHRSSSVPTQTARAPTKDARRVKGATEPGADEARSQTTPAAAAAELSRCSKILRRMRWKLPFLDLAYQQATADHGPGDETRAEAELMFKLDFFDYYMLCERVLVHLQGVFGISISRERATQDVSVPLQASGGKSGRSNHRYHANVLDALDRKENPLHEVLGTGDVRRHLARAKDLRNHWKNADEDDGKGSQEKKTPPALFSYDLASILTSIHRGLDSAYAAASEYVALLTEATAKGTVHGMDTVPMDIAQDESEAGWSFMVDAMDWEAV